MFKNARVISFFTLISRIFGYIRDFFIANYFGATVYTDLFFIAFKIPNTFRRLLGEGAVLSGVVPVISKLDGQKKSRAVGNIMLVFAAGLFFTAIAGVLLSKVLILLFAPGFIDSQYFVLLNNMVKIIFPYIFFIGLSVLIMGIMNAYDRFAMPAFVPVLLNISIITGIYFFYYKFRTPVYVLCAGVIAGGILQFAASVLGLFIYKIPFRIRFRVEDSTREILHLILFAAMSGGILQLAGIIDSFLASFMKHGSFSYLSYANRLFQLPFAVLSIALMQASLPSLSKLKGNELWNKVSSLAYVVAAFSIPITLYVLFFGQDAVRLLFGHGKFTMDSVHNTYIALVWMIIGFIFFSEVKILSNFFYAQKDTKTPLKASSIAAVSNIAASIIFGLLFGFAGLAAAVSLSGAVNAAALFFYIKQKKYRLSLKTFFDYKILFLGLGLTVASLLIRYTIQAIRYDFVMRMIIAGCIYSSAVWLVFRNRLKI